MFITPYFHLILYFLVFQIHLGQSDNRTISDDNDDTFQLLSNGSNATNLTQPSTTIRSDPVTEAPVPQTNQRLGDLCTQHGECARGLYCARTSVTEVHDSHGAKIEETKIIQNCTDCSACKENPNSAINGKCPEDNCQRYFNYKDDAKENRAIRTAVPLLALVMFSGFACCAVFRPVECSEYNHDLRRECCPWVHQFRSSRRGDDNAPGAGVRLNLLPPLLRPRFMAGDNAGGGAAAVEQQPPAMMEEQQQFLAEIVLDEDDTDEGEAVIPPPPPGGGGGGGDHQAGLPPLREGDGPPEEELRAAAALNLDNDARYYGTESSV